MNQADQCLRALAAASFVDIAAEIVRAEWRVPDAQGLIAALAAGTVRIAALLAAQQPKALAAIVADIDARAARYRVATTGLPSRPCWRAAAMAWIEGRVAF